MPESAREPYRSARSRLLPVSDRAAEHAVDRERSRTLPKQQVAEPAAAGDVVGNAWSDAASTLGPSSTVVTRSDGRLRVGGRKFYTTGSIFADWADVAATFDGADVTVAVRTTGHGMRIDDDCDGFGQRLTGTGTIVLTDAGVAEEDLATSDRSLPSVTGLFQLVLLAVPAGIAAAVGRDAAIAVRARQRAYGHGSAASPGQDPLIQSVVGEISAIAFTARALVREVAGRLDAAADAVAAGDAPATERTAVEAEIASAQAQVILTEQVPRAATLSFDALGASATARAQDLDRHRRNARTVASHNPAASKRRIVGDFAINGTRPPFLWRVGTPAEARAEATGERT